MHLSYSTFKYKDKTYKTYSIAESFREGGKVKKRTNWSIDKLTDIQAAQIKLICKIVKSKEQLLSQIENIIVKESKSYLDLTIVNELWNH